MTKLQLIPTLKELSREEIERHIEMVRARRMVAAVEYQAGQTAKLEYETEKLQKQIRQAYDMLGKELERLDRALASVEERLEKITLLQSEHGFIVDYELEPEKPS